MKSKISLTLILPAVSIFAPSALSSSGDVLRFFLSSMKCKIAWIVLYFYTVPYILSLSSSIIMVSKWWNSLGSDAAPIEVNGKMPLNCLTTFWPPFSWYHKFSYIFFNCDLEDRAKESYHYQWHKLSVHFFLNLRELWITFLLEAI